MSLDKGIWLPDAKLEGVTLGLDEAIEEMFSSPEFRQFGKYSRELRVDVAKHDGEARQNLDRDWSRIVDLFIDFDRPSKPWWVSFAPVLFGLGVVLLLTILSSIWFGFPTAVDPSFLIFAIIIAVLITAAEAAFAVLFVLRRRRAEVDAMLAANYLTRTLSSHNGAVKLAAAELLSGSVNRVLGPKGILQLPRSAPRLVELDSRLVVPSQAVKQIRRFLADHVSSAVGVAGPRGSGKTSLMSELQSADPKRATVYVSIPVSYEPIDFLKRLVVEVCVSFLGERSVYEPVPRAYGVLLASALTMVAGVLVAIAPLLSLVPNGELFIPVGAGLVLFVAGYFFFLTTLGRRSRALRRQKTREFRGSDVDELARDALEWVTYDVEQTSSVTNSISPISAWKFDNSRGKNSRRRALSQSELVTTLRDLLKAAGASGRWQSVYILVDELDKLSESSHAIDAINLLKDFFHIENVHFVVSVSEEALSNFEARGFGVRDAFDSSFDVVVRILPMTASESQRVLDSRVEGLPSAAVLSCHAWSGGLPRDLLRHARSLVELVRQHKSTVSLRRLLRESYDETALRFVTALRVDASEDETFVLFQIEDILAHSPKLSLTEISERLFSLASAGELVDRPKTFLEIHAQFLDQLLSWVDREGALAQLPDLLVASAESVADLSRSRTANLTTWSRAVTAAREACGVVL